MQTINPMSSVQNSTHVVKLIEGKYWNEIQVVKNKRKLKKLIFWIGF